MSVYCECTFVLPTATALETQGLLVHTWAEQKSIPFKGVYISGRFKGNDKDKYRTNGAKFSVAASKQPLESIVK